MVFQNPDASLNPTRSVGDAIMRPLVLLGGYRRKEAAERARRLLAAVSLPESYYYRLPHELSGGEKQRVAIARAFAADPELILCDEPISSLDVSVQGSLMNLLMKLQLEQCTSYVFISHDLSAVQHLSDKIAVVYLGRIMEIGDAADVLSPPFHPYTEALLSAVPVPTPPSNSDPSACRGRCRAPWTCRPAAASTHAARAVATSAVSRNRRGAKERAATRSAATSPGRSCSPCRWTL